MLEMKKCTKCGELKPETNEHFIPKETGKNGFNAQCRVCMVEHASIEYEKKKELIASHPKLQHASGIKTCPRCKRDLPANKIHFKNSNLSYDGLLSICKECRGGRFTQPKKEAKRGCKICSKCGEEYLLTSEYFKIRKGSKDGYQGQCLLCTSSYDKQYRQENREVLLEQCRIYQKENRDTIRIREKIYHENNKEAISERSTKYHKMNKVHRNELSRQYKKNHSDDYKIHEHNRRAKKKGLSSTLTAQQWRDAKLFFNNECAYCQKELPLAQEHFFPLSKGGEYTKDNIIPACGLCNNSKNAKSPFEWYPKQPFYTKKNETKILKYLGYKNQKQQLSIF